MEKFFPYEFSQEQKQEQETNLINYLTTIIASSLNVRDIFESFAQELKKVVAVDWATIALIDGNELHFLAMSTSIGSAWQEGEKILLEGTATEWVCWKGEGLYEADLARHYKFWTGGQHLKQGIKSIVYLPLIVKNKGIGSLILASRQPNAYSLKQRKFLEQVGLQIAVPIENERLYTRAEQRSRIDEITGLFNRRYFEERFKEEVDRCSRYDNEFSIFMLDLDNFKAYNDNYGHTFGDNFLNQAGKFIKDSIRNVDQVFRYGGDEFVVILPYTAINDAHVVAERVRGLIDRKMGTGKVPVTCSIGLANYPSDTAMSESLLLMIDTALYYAKWSGGNRIRFFSKLMSESLEYIEVHARRNVLNVVYALTSTVEARDQYTHGHSRKVNNYAVALAESIGLSSDIVIKISASALLHDIGKIGIPDKVLNKKGKLNSDDWEAIKSHPETGAKIINNIPELASCVSDILYHHERWDGGGYPEGLKGKEIPIGARVLAIADSFEAMTSTRPYRRALHDEEVLKELRRCAGFQFDPELIEAFISIVEAGFPEEVG